MDVQHLAFNDARRMVLKLVFGCFCLQEEGMRERLGYSSSNNSDKVYKFILLRFFVAEFFIRFFKVVWNLTLKMLPVM